MKRIRHSCGVLIADNGYKQIIVAGGTNEQGSILDSVETLSVSENETIFAQEWLSGPNLPLSLSDAAGVTSSDHKAFYIVGGSISNIDESSYVFKMGCFNVALQCQWRKMDTELEMPSSRGLALIMPSISMVSKNYNNTRDCFNGIEQFDCHHMFNSSIVVFLMLRVRWP